MRAAVRADQRRRWRQGDRLLLELYLKDFPKLRADANGLLELIDGEINLRLEGGARPKEVEYQSRFPQLRDALQRRFALYEALAGSLLPPGSSEPPAPVEAPDPCPSLPLADQITVRADDTENSFQAHRDTPTVPGYVILDIIGRGGMGVVYKARQVSLNRIVALKMILSGASAGGEERARFRTEVAAMARLRHPNVVQIYEVGELPDGRPYFAMEFVEGTSLRQRLRGKPLPNRMAAELIEKLARAMHVVHDQGIVHRDLKPGNILLEAAPEPGAGLGIPRITDFGVAKQLDVEDGQTRTGALVGSPGYIAPEQAAGRIHQIGPATDVYALGVILYELLTGRAPFRSNSVMKTIRLVLEQSPERLRLLNPQVDAALEAICLKCLEKNPLDRYATAEALADDLAAYLQGQPVLADASTSMHLLRLFLQENRHTEVLALWGRVFLCHAGQVFYVTLAMALMQLAGLKTDRPAVYYGVLGLLAATMLVPVWYFRIRRRLRLTLVEQQLGLIWTFIVTTVVLTGALKYLIDADPPWRMFPVIILEIGLGCACTGALLGGSFYLLALVCAILALLTAIEPQLNPMMFGLALAIGLFLPGWRYSKPSQRKHKANPTRK